MVVLDDNPVGAATAIALDRAIGVLAAGGAVVLPTDTVYGLAALPSVPGATDQLFALKGRAGTQPFAVLVADTAQALELVEPPAPEVRGWMDRHWPGPLTLVLRRSPAAGALALGGDAGTIGVRCPAHRFVRALAAAVGPLATTSANRHGEPSPTTAQAAASSLTATVGLVVDGGPAGTVASTVVDASGPAGAPWRVLREGAITPGVLSGRPGSEPIR